jgi:hypothetical protein
MSEPIPFPSGPNAASEAGMDAEMTEVTLDGAPAAAPSRATHRLPDEPDLVTELSEVLLAPLNVLPAETRAHLRTAGREVALTLTSLTGTVLKGAAIALNVAAETLKDYTTRNSTASAAQPTRRRVEIEVE